MLHILLILQLVKAQIQYIATCNEQKTQTESCTMVVKVYNIEFYGGVIDVTFSNHFPDQTIQGDYLTSSSFPTLLQSSTSGFRFSDYELDNYNPYTFQIYPIIPVRSNFSSFLTITVYDDFEQQVLEQPTQVELVFQPTQYKDHQLQFLNTVVGQISQLQLQLQIDFNIPNDIFLRVYFPIYNFEAPEEFQISYISDQVSCTTNDGQDISCSKISNFYLDIEYSQANVNLIISGISTPYSLKLVEDIKIYVMFQNYVCMAVYQGQSIGVTQVVQPSNVALYQNTTQVSAQCMVRLELTPSLFYLLGSSLGIGLPSAILKDVNILSFVMVYNLKQEVSIIYRRNYIIFKNVVESFISSQDQIIIEIHGIILSAFEVTAQSFQVQIYDPDFNLQEEQTDQLSIITQHLTISQLTVSPINSTIFANTNMVIEFTLVSTHTFDSIITISFPSTVVVENLISQQCPWQFSGLSKFILCSANSNIVTIENAFTRIIFQTQDVVLKIPAKMPLDLTESETFTLQTTDNDRLINIFNGQVTVQATSFQIGDVIITPSEFITGISALHAFQFDIAQVTDGSYVICELPLFYRAQQQSCQVISGGSIQQCTIESNNQLKFYVLSGKTILYLNNIITQRSLEPFEDKTIISVYNGINQMIANTLDQINTRITLTTSNYLTDYSVTCDELQLGAEANYHFRFICSNQLQSTDKIKVKLPIQLTDIIKCSIECSINQNQVLISLEDIQLTNNDNQTPIEFIITINNPQMPIELNPFQIQIMTHNDYMIATYHDPFGIALPMYHTTSENGDLSVSLSSFYIQDQTNVDIDIVLKITIPAFSRIVITYTSGAFYIHSLNCELATGENIFCEELQPQGDLLRLQVTPLQEIQQPRFTLTVSEYQISLNQEQSFPVQFGYTVYSMRDEKLQKGYLTQEFQFICSDNCNTCHNKYDICDTCLEDQILYENKCYLTCPAGTVADDNNDCLPCLTAKICQQCDPEDRKKCQICDDGYLLMNGNCILQEWIGRDDNNNTQSNDIISEVPDEIQNESQTDETRDIDETVQTEEIDEINETDEINQNDEFNEADEINETDIVDEIDEINQTDEISETDQINVIDESDKIDENDKIDESDETFSEQSQSNENTQSSQSSESPIDENYDEQQQINKDKNIINQDKVDKTLFTDDYDHLSDLLPFLLIFTAILILTSIIIKICKPQSSFLLTIFVLINSIELAASSARIFRFIVIYNFTYAFLSISALVGVLTNQVNCAVSISFIFYTNPQVLSQSLSTKGQLWKLGTLFHQWKWFLNIFQINLNDDQPYFVCKPFLWNSLLITLLQILVYISYIVQYQNVPMFVIDDLSYQSLLFLSNLQQLRQLYNQMKINRNKVYPIGNEINDKSPMIFMHTANYENILKEDV